MSRGWRLPRLDIFSMPPCHCEERSDEAIPTQLCATPGGDCFVATLLAMTGCAAWSGLGGLRRVLVERQQDGTGAVDQGLDDRRLGRAEIERVRQAARGADAGGAPWVEQRVLLGLGKLAELAIGAAGDRSGGFGLGGRRLGGRDRGLVEPPAGILDTGECRRLSLCSYINAATAS
jgi:hypothetical protein